MKAVIPCCLVAALILALAPMQAARAGELDPTVLSRALASVVSVLPDVPEEAYDGQEPEGSGVVVLDGRHVVTALHVVDKAITVRVRTHDHRILPAAVVGRDGASDLALLSLEEALPALAFGGNPALGAPVCAIGNAFGLGLSVSCGHVSAVHRSGVGFNTVEDFVQTDAAVNPGSSGGALVDAEGRLVGVLSAIFTKTSEANVGVNFAVSAPLARKAARELRREGQVRWTLIGAVLVPYMPTTGAGRLAAEVLRVFPDSPAGLAGLKRGDRIVRVASRRTVTPGDVTAALALADRGRMVPMLVERQGREIELALRVPLTN